MNEKTKEILKERMRKRRKELQLTQEMFAKNGGFTQQVISDWERGRNYPNLENMIRIAITLRTSIDWLLGLDELENE